MPSDRRPQAEAVQAARMETPEEVPMRVAPASIIASASTSVRMPPAALTRARPATASAISRTSATVAPPADGAS